MPAKRDGDDRRTHGSVVTLWSFHFQVVHASTKGCRCAEGKLWSQQNCAASKDAITSKWYEKQHIVMRCLTPFFFSFEPLSFGSSIRIQEFWMDSTNYNSIPIFCAPIDDLKENKIQSN